MEVERDKMSVNVRYRGKDYTTEVPGDATVGLLGRQLSQLTGVDLHTMRLLVPKGRGAPAAPLHPASEPHSSQSIKSSGISPGIVLRMMGATSKEIQEVNQPVEDGRVLGFEEEQRRLQPQPAARMSRSFTLPNGPYIFQNFRLLMFPFIELNPPANKARDIMFRLARDPGIVAIMNKYKWTVRILSELAPERFVGVSHKCVLGFNKNRGEEISLRLRTADEQGFRKYTSIKKTLLHELAHMVHDEHDENFHALEMQLYQEAIDLDWTKGRGLTLSGQVRSAEADEDEYESTDIFLITNRYVPGGSVPHSWTAGSRNAATEAAMTRLVGGLPKIPNHRNTAHLAATRIVSDHDQLTQHLMLARIKQAESALQASENKQASQKLNEQAGAELDKKNGRTEPDPDEALQHSPEPDPDESTSRSSFHPVSVDQDSDTSKGFQEPDPDDMLMKKETDCQPLPEKSMDFTEPDPDPDSIDTLLREVPNPDESIHLKEPDPDESVHSGEPDPDESVKAHETNPDENRHDPRLHPDEIGRIRGATFAAMARLHRAIDRLLQQATPAETTPAIETLSTIVSYFLNYPIDSMHEVLSKGDPRFHNLVGRFEGAVEFLRVVGFVDVVGGDNILVLLEADPGLLWLALTILDDLMALSSVHPVSVDQDSNISRNFQEPDPDDILMKKENVCQPVPEKIMDFSVPNLDESTLFKEEPGPNESTHPEEPDPDEIGRTRDSTFSAMARLRRAIDRLIQQATPAEATAAIERLSFIVSIRLNNPNASEYVVLRMGDPRLYNLVGRFEGAVEFLRVVGFVDEVVGSDYNLVLQRADPEVLWLALTMLDDLMAL